MSSAPERIWLAYVSLECGAISNSLLSDPTYSYLRNFRGTSRCFDLIVAAASVE